MNSPRSPTNKSLHSDENQPAYARLTGTLRIININYLITLLSKCLVLFKLLKAFSFIEILIYTLHNPFLLTSLLE